MIRLFAVLASICLVSACESTPKTSDTPPAESAVAEGTAPAEAPMEAMTLDGKTFTVQVTDPTGAVSPDTLHFANGMFDSKDCAQYGFTAAKYEVLNTEGAMAFAVTTSSEEEGLMKWKGTVNGDKISGEYEWVKEGQAPAKATFEGTVQ